MPTARITSESRPRSWSRRSEAGWPATPRG